MKYFSNKLLLASSCLALALAAPLPLLGMESEDNEPASIPVAAATPLQEPVQEESWKDSLYAFPEIQAGFKVEVFNKFLLELFKAKVKDPIKEGALFHHLEQAAFERWNKKALETVKQFSTKKMLGINRVDRDKEKKADKALAEISISELTAQLNGFSHSKYLYERGWGYQEGLGVKKDPDLAIPFFFRSLEMDPSADTLLILGALYYQGISSIPQNQTIAQLLWEKADAGGNKLAAGNLAILYWHAQNFSKAIEYFKKASEQGDLNSTLNLAASYYRGENSIEKDHEQALKYFLRAFNNKEISTKEKNKCADHIGSIYYNGFPGTPPNYEKALKFFLKTDADSLDTQSKIINCYGKLKDRKKFFQWSLRAAQQDDPRALYNVGCAYADGGVTKKNIPQAKKAFKDAVEILKSRTELSEQEKFVLPRSLYNYSALMKNVNTTYPYMLQAAEMGYSPAMTALGGYYLRGKTPDELAKAFFWIKKAQELNDPKAQTLFDAATKKAQEGKEASKDDKDLVECIESLEQPKVENSLESDDSPSVPSPQESSSSSDSSEEEEVKPTAIDYTITPQEVEEWQAEQAKWKEDIKNPKFVREKLQQAHQDFQDKQKGQERPPLSSTAAKTIETLRDKGLRSKITIDNLFNLFEDPYFQGQVDMSKTSDGYAIVGYNFMTGKIKSTGTHRKHNKSYKGLDANFLKSVAELVEEFIILPSVQG